MHTHSELEIQWPASLDNTDISVDSLSFFGNESNLRHFLENLTKHRPQQQEQQELQQQQQQESQSYLFEQHQQQQHQQMSQNYQEQQPSQQQQLLLNSSQLQSSYLQENLIDNNNSVISFNLPSPRTVALNTENDVELEGDRAGNERNERNGGGYGDSNGDLPIEDDLDDENNGNISENMNDVDDSDLFIVNGHLVAEDPDSLDNFLENAFLEENNNNHHHLGDRVYNTNNYYVNNIQHHNLGYYNNNTITTSTIRNSNNNLASHNNVDSHDNFLSDEDLIMNNKNHKTHHSQSSSHSAIRKEISSPFLLHHSLNNKNNVLNNSDLFDSLNNNSSYPFLSNQIYNNNQQNQRVLRNNYDNEEDEEFDEIEEEKKCLQLQFEQEQRQKQKQQEQQKQNQLNANEASNGNNNLFNNSNKEQQRQEEEQDLNPFEEKDFDLPQCHFELPDFSDIQVKPPRPRRLRKKKASKPDRKKSYLEDIAEMPNEEEQENESNKNEKQHGYEEESDQNADSDTERNEPLWRVTQRIQSVKKQKDYDKNICRYIARCIVRCFVHDSYKKNVITFIQKQIKTPANTTNGEQTQNMQEQIETKYQDCKSFFLGKIESLSGHRALQELLSFNDENKYQEKSIFRSFCAWFLKERAFRYIVSGNMKDKKSYLRYKNQIMLRFITKPEKWTSNYKKIKKK